MNGGCQNHNEMARKRWKLLARALHRSKEEPDKLSEDIISVRRISNFGLLNLRQLENISNDPDAHWYEYSAMINDTTFTLKIRHLIKTITPVDLMGFNNTGNVCVWPSEEVLAYYALCNTEAFHHKKVLELGGGMTCLAGLLILKYTRASKVHLTDGNPHSVDNVRYIIDENGFKDSSRVSCDVLKWGSLPKYHEEYDVLLAADCLFFDDARSDLVVTMWSALCDDGQALVTAPRRGSTLDKFKTEAEERGFVCTVFEYYNQEIWNRHLELKAKNNNYDQDIHYPILLHLLKPRQ
ncbi:calmodulin-lysine N-methyltransferase-like isoform X2 [Macrosteles quadrilineatus]|uniref:calmodulin-lysine N-methyltransferase-like isoform X2 n=1 Tax=Macrosteles quadrilineatus TaxID=74068 RepID=UPI0023E24B21|nr:calmodulin-lysine N-methyltransferase-like isoform X2 [Macrosteles quadrilineatus]XP_054261095.1 calmodulin-lysine N-methyltransferase-like isoform X2 [Macrosteles quadrilineatus]XP_054261096.1 calmodulin-lysine N-methyltransferase-like isoform X2 [Macrosteles quadrilineatus]